MGIEESIEFMLGEIKTRLLNIETTQSRMETKLDLSCAKYDERISKLEIWQSNLRAQTGLLGVLGGAVAYAVAWLFQILKK